MRFFDFRVIHEMHHAIVAHTKEVDFHLRCVCVDNVAPDSVPLYFGTALFFRLLGPLAGFGLGAICNHYYHDFSSKCKMNPDQDLFSHLWPYYFWFLKPLTASVTFLSWNISSKLPHFSRTVQFQSLPRRIRAGFQLGTSDSWWWQRVWLCLDVWLWCVPLSYWQFENWNPTNQFEVVILYCPVLFGHFNSAPVKTDRAVRIQ